MRETEKELSIKRESEIEKGDRRLRGCLFFTWPALWRKPSVACAPREEQGEGYDVR